MKIIILEDEKQVAVKMSLLLRLILIIEINKWK